MRRPYGKLVLRGKRQSTAPAVVSDEGVNAVLEAAAARYDNLHVVPWNALAAQHPEWFSGADVHPSTEGYTARAQQAATAVAELCR